MAATHPEVVERMKGELKRRPRGGSTVPVKRPKCLLPSLLLVGSLTCLAAGAEDEAPPDAKALKAAGIELDAQKREVRVDATVCLDKGILEYLVCLPQTFEHEAIFCTKGRPSLLHLSLLAIGMEPCAFAADEEWWAKAREKQRSHVRIEVEYEQDGRKQRRRISEFLVNREQKDGIVPDAWVFTGSFFFKKEGKSCYAADHTGAVIGLCQEGASVLQYGEQAGVPYRGEDQGLEVNTQTVPAVGTKVTLIFGRHEEKEPPSGQPVKDSQTPGEAKP
jgi:hypothetical protein